ncbi:NADH-quinone oxidoreductase subunit NuoK [candidate division KSB1 bacterium]
MISLNSFLIVGALLFVMGLLAVLTKRNAISILMGVELILNAAILNFVAFSRFTDAGMNGVMVALFIFVIAVSEAAVALAIVINIYRNMHTVNVDEISSLKK